MSLTFYLCRDSKQFDFEIQLGIKFDYYLLSFIPQTHTYQNLSYNVSAIRLSPYKLNEFNCGLRNINIFLSKLNIKEIPELSYINLDKNELFVYSSITNKFELIKE